MLCHFPTGLLQQSFESKKKKKRKEQGSPSYLLNANRNEVMTDQKGRVLEFLFLSASSDTTPDSMVASRMSEGANVSEQVASHTRNLSTFPLCK